MSLSSPSFDDDGGRREAPVDPDSDIFRMGSVCGLNSFLTLVDWEGLGEGDRDILSLREKSSGSTSGVVRDTMTYFCLRREDGDCWEETDAPGFGFGYEVAACWILSDLSLGRFELG